MERISYPKSPIAVSNLERNRLALASKLGRMPEWTPPSPPHYEGLYLWDEVMHDVINARHGSTGSLAVARRGYKALLEGQQDNGLIPNAQHIHRRFDPEKIAGFNGEDHSNYTQPPILAFGVSEIYDGLLAEEGAESAQTFLSDIYEQTKFFYEYLDNFRKVASDDRRMFIINPHETGIDSGPTYDKWKTWRLPRQGLSTPFFIDKANIGLDYLQSVAISRRLGKSGNDMEKARQSFGAVDLMMNCLLVDNLYIMSDLALKLGKTEDVGYFSKYASDIEEKIHEKNWFPEARAGSGMFYSTDLNGNPLVDETINNLFALLLPNLNEDQLESVLFLMDNSFDTKFVLASVGTGSRNFDPHYREFERLWRGPIWMITNFLIYEEGLLKQLTRTELAHRPDLLKNIYGWAVRIAEDSETLLDNEGPREFYNPLTGKGQRSRTLMFGWSNAAYTMTPIKLLEPYVSKIF